jgi:hypothetical protein
VQTNAFRQSCFPQTLKRHTAKYPGRPNHAQQQKQKKAPKESPAPGTIQKEKNDNQSLRIPIRGFAFFNPPDPETLRIPSPEPGLSNPGFEPDALEAPDAVVDEVRIASGLADRITPAAAGFFSEEEE